LKHKKYKHVCNIKKFLSLYYLWFDEKSIKKLLLDIGVDDRKRRMKFIT